MNIFKDKKILITGGAGCIGSHLARTLLKYKPKGIRILDNSEYDVYRLKREFKNDVDYRYLIGDVRDKARLESVIQDIDIVFHCAALKHVDLCEHNPFDAIQTNVIGTNNLINAAIKEEVEKFILISTDKAPNPVSVMGTTKLLAERLTMSAYYYKGLSDTIFSIVRFGNVIGSSGSVVHTFMNQIKNGGPVTITHNAMTRFMMSVDDATKLIIKATELAAGKEIFILKMPSMYIDDLANAMLNKYGHHGMGIDMIGSRIGEKIHEELMTIYEAENAYENSEMIIVTDEEHIIDYYTQKGIGFKKAELKSYSSDNARIMNMSEINGLLDKIQWE